MINYHTPIWICTSICSVLVGSDGLRDSYDRFIHIRQLYCAQPWKNALNMQEILGMYFMSIGFVTLVLSNNVCHFPRCFYIWIYILYMMKEAIAVFAMEGKNRKTISARLFMGTFLTLELEIILPRYDAVFRNSFNNFSETDVSIICLHAYTLPHTPGRSFLHINNKCLTMG